MQAVRKRWHCNPWGSSHPDVFLSRQASASLTYVILCYRRAFPLALPPLPESGPARDAYVCVKFAVSR